MKTRLLFISMVGFMVSISATVFSQTTAPVTKQPIHKFIQPTTDGKNEGIKASSQVAPSIQSTSSVATQPPLHKYIQPASGKSENVKTSSIVVPTSPTMAVKPPMHKFIQPVSDSKVPVKQQ